MAEPKKEQQEPNWTELLEKEYLNAGYGQLVETQRKDGHSDKEIYQFLEAFS